MWRRFRSIAAPSTDHNQVFRLGCFLAAKYQRSTYSSAEVSTASPEDTHPESKGVAVGKMTFDAGERCLDISGCA